MYVRCVLFFQPCDGYFSVEAESETFGVYYFNIFALRDDYSGEESYTLEIRAVVSTSHLLYLVNGQESYPTIKLTI